MSLLAINTVNSIETFTDADITYKYHKKDGGFLHLYTENAGEDALLLLNAFCLGIRSVKDQYGTAIEIEDDEND